MGCEFDGELKLDKLDRLDHYMQSQHRLNLILKTYPQINSRLEFIYPGLTLPPFISIPSPYMIDSHWTPVNT